MTNLKNGIKKVKKSKNVNPKPSKEMLEVLKEVNEMINNPEKYPRYNNREDLKKALLSNN